jgi:hypothetical protein
LADQLRPASDQVGRDPQERQTWQGQHVVDGAQGLVGRLGLGQSPRIRDDREKLDEVLRR